MLSHIYRIVMQFEQTHGYRPNLLYLNPIHFYHLREQLDNRNIEQIRLLLGMEIIITNDAIHPHVAAVKLHQQCSVG